MDSFPVCAKVDKSFKHVMLCYAAGVSQNNLFYWGLGNVIVLPECEEEEIEKEVRRMKGILGKDVDEEPEVELPDEEMKLRELRKDYDDSEFVWHTKAAWKPRNGIKWRRNTTIRV